MSVAIPIISAQTCGNCRFSEPDGERLQCRWGPPTANAVMGPDGAGGFKLLGVLSVYPVREKSDARCGRYERGVAKALGLPKGIAIE